MQNPSSTHWRRIDEPGSESASFYFLNGQWVIHGKVDFQQQGIPYALTYQILCNAAWETQSVSISGTKGDEKVQVFIENQAGQWYLNGIKSPECEGCIDIDLSFSPSTNTLPIRRKPFALGEKKNLRMAWLRLPNFTLELLEQSYERLDSVNYRYRSNSFTADLEVDENGIVVNYPGAWELVRS